PAAVRLRVHCDDLCEPAVGDPCLAAERPDRLSTGRLGGHGDARGLSPELGRLAVHAGTDGLRLTNGLDTVLGVVARPEAAAAPLHHPGCVSTLATSGLSGFSRADMADAGDDSGPLAALFRLHRLHPARQLSEGPAIALLPRRHLPRLSGART